MAIENFAEVQTYMDTNKEVAEVKTYLDTFKVQPSLEVFKGLTNTDADYKSYMDSEKDKHLSKGIETFKTNNLDKIYQDRFKLENPTADPRDIELNKMRAEFEAMKNESSRKDLTNKALKLAEQKKLPSSLIDFFIGDSEESTTKNLEALESVFSTQVEAIVLERLKSGYKPPIDNNGGVTYTKEQISKMSPTEFNKLYDTNREAIQKAMSQK